MNDLGTPTPSVFVLIPERDYLVVFDDGVIPLPDAEVLEELEIQADQRCAPATLGAVSDALLTVAEAIAGNVLTTAIGAAYPALGRYLGRVKEVLRRPRSRPAALAAGECAPAGEAGTAQPAPDHPQPPTAAQRPAPQVAQRTRIALKATVGDLAGEPELRRDPETTALRARVQTSTGSVVEVRVESSARIICVTVDED